MTPGGGALAVSQLFEAHVKVLELEHRLGSAPMVVIARSEDGKSYFAIERESKDLYAVCRLGSWVRINQLCMAAVVSRYHLEIETRIDVGQPPSAKGIIEQPVITTEASKYSKKKRLAIEAIQSMVKRPSRDISAISENAAVLQPHSKTDMEPQLQESGDVTGVQGEILAQPAATDILENIRSQYFEALYISKVSYYGWEALFFFFLVNDIAGLPCVFCQRSIIKGSCGFSFRLRLAA
jgi:DNA replication regulator SLD3